MTIVSCQQQDNPSPTNSKSSKPILLSNADITVTNNIVTFNSISAYENFIDNGSVSTKQSVITQLDSISNYISLKKVYEKSFSSSQARTLSTKEKEMAEINSFFSSLINSDGLIQIGDYLFKIDLDIGKVFVLPPSVSSNKQAINDLKKENTSNKNILVFSTDDDVLNLLANDSNGTMNGRTMLFCHESGAPSGSDKAFEYAYNDTERQDNKVVYQKAGIYFSLQAKIKTEEKYAGLWVASADNQLYLDYYFNYKPKCKGSRTESNTVGAFDHELNRRPYASTRGLHYYDYVVQFYGLNFQSGVYEIRAGI